MARGEEAAGHTGKGCDMKLDEISRGVIEEDRV